MDLLFLYFKYPNKTFEKELNKKSEKISIGEMSGRGTVRSGKWSVGEVSGRGTVQSGKWSVGEVSGRGTVLGELSVGELSGGEMVSRELSGRVNVRESKKRRKNFLIDHTIFSK